MKKRNYIKELKDEDILSLLKTLGYELTIVVNRRTGDILPPIERGEDEEGNEKLFIRCKEIENKMEKTFELLKGTQIESIYNYLKNGVAGDFLDGKGFLYISNFDILDSFMNNMLEFNKKETPYEESTQYKFANFMADKFGEEYVEDYNNFVNEYNASLLKEQQNEKENEVKDETKKDDVELEL